MALSDADIDAAINIVLTTGQTVSVEGMTYTAANLNDLYALKQRDQSADQRAGGTRPTMLGYKLSNMGY